MFRKLIIITILFYIFIPVSTINACAFDAAIPETKSDDYIDSYYYKLDFEKSGVDPELYLFDENYLYVVLTKEFIYVEAFLQDILGIYVLDGTQVKTVEQSATDQHTVIITFNDGETMEINSRKQNDNPSNIIYLDDVELGFSVKDEYKYMYETDEDGVGDSSLDDKKGDEKESKGGFFVPLTIMFLLFGLPTLSILYVNRTGENK